MNPPVSLAALGLGLLTCAASAASTSRPNILWLTCEDTGPQLGCYGDAYAVTPNLDAFAQKSLRYRVCWSSAPVCAPARTTIISGVYPTSTGSEHMRSGVPLPGWMKLYPQSLGEQGYYCSNNSKEDYNLVRTGKVWDDSSPRAHWKNRAPGQPFFAVFNSVVTHESQIRARPHTLRHDPARVRLPAYHPDTPEVRQDWAQYYDQVTTMDAQVGARLRELEQAGLMEETIVFFYGDHGSGMPRSKRWPYNSGLQVPLIVYVPEKFRALAPSDYQAGGWSERLVAFVDLAPTVLSLAGIPPPDWMQGRAFLGPHTPPPARYLHGFRGRMDERYDLVRSVRNARFIYVRQYMPHLIYGQHIDYMFQTPTTRVWKQLYDEGKLAPPQTCFWERKPPEELYDLQADPDEVNNLVESPAHQEILNELRQAQREQALRVRDVGFLAEAELHRRAAGTTPYDVGHDPGRYPLVAILRMADLATRPASNDLPRLKDGLRDAESGVRYWAAMGMLVRGKAAVGGARAALYQALEDESPSVRVVAARALGEHGSKTDLEKALAALKELVSPEANGAYVSMLALNAADALGDKASPLREQIRSMPTKDPTAAARASGYVERLVETILKQAK